MGSDLIENQNNLITVEKLLNNKYFVTKLVVLYKKDKV